MPIKTDSLEEPQLNLTPMIDVVFLLIIFFMVGARFTEDEQPEVRDRTTDSGTCPDHQSHARCSCGGRRQEWHDHDGKRSYCRNSFSRS